MILRDFRGYSLSYQEQVYAMPNLRIEGDDSYILMIRCPNCGSLLTGHERKCPHCHIRIRHKKIIKFLLDKPNVTLAEYSKPLVAGYYVSIKFDSIESKTSICEAVTPYIGIDAYDKDAEFLRCNIRRACDINYAAMKYTPKEVWGRQRTVRSVFSIAVIDIKQADLFIQAIRDFMKDHPDSPLVTDSFQLHIDEMYETSRLLPKTFDDRTLLTPEEIEENIGRPLTNNIQVDMFKRYGDKQLKKIYGYGIANLIRDVDTDV